MRNLESRMSEIPGYIDVRRAPGEVWPGVGEVPRELPLVRRLLISLMITAFSSLNCSSPAIACDKAVISSTEEQVSKQI